MSQNYIHPTAVIYENVIMGKGNYIGPGCVIGAPAESRPNWNPQSPGRVIIGDNNILTGMVTVDGGMEGDTIIFNDCFLMKHSHVGHDGILHDGVTLSCGAKVGGHSIIGKGTNIGLNAVIHQRCYVPEGCMIGASGFVGKKNELKPHYKYAGVPVKELGPNVTHEARTHSTQLPGAE